MSKCRECGIELTVINQFPSERKKGYKLCKSCEKKKHNQWVANHRTEWNLKIKERQKKERLEALSLLGNKCIRCGETDWRCLQIDHKRGGGSKEQKILGYWPKFHKILKKLRNGSKAYQCLCANCNWRKKYENQEV